MAWSVVADAPWVRAARLADTVEEIRSLLKRQLMEPVRWEQCMEEVTKPFHNHTAYIESGPGKQLKAMMRRIDQDAWGKMTTLE